MTGDDDEALLVGVVARAHGNRGGVIVNLETDFPDERFARGAELLVGPARTPRRIEEVRFQQGRPVVRFSGIETMNDAEALAGAEIRIAAAALAPLPENTYYRHDLVGCRVEEQDGTPVGTVTRVEGPIDRSLLVVPRQGGEVMIPLVDEFCSAVDLDARRIVVRLPEGLLDL